MFSREAMRISTLISCLLVSLILNLRTAEAQNAPQPAGNTTLFACEKQLAREVLDEKKLLRDGFKKLVKKGVGVSVAGVGYKAYKLSNTVKRKDVVKALKEHGVSNPRTIEAIAPRITSIIKGKIFRRGAVGAIIVGGVIVVFSGGDDAKASTSVGPSDQASPGTVRKDEDFEYDDADNPTSRPMDRAANPVIAAPIAQRSKTENERFDDLKSALKYEFGEKDKLAVWFADRSTAKYKDVRGDDVIYSRLQACSDEKETDPEQVKLAENAQRACLAGRTQIECLFEQEPVRNTLKNIISQIALNNDEISFDPRTFEGD